MRLLAKFWLAVLLVVLFMALAWSLIFGDSIPKHDGYVNDYAEVLSEEFEDKLETKLREYDADTSNQIMVVTIKSLEGESIEQFTISLAQEWGVGQKEEDNGIVFLTSIEDRELRIEVGYGLEGDVTDLEAKQIIDGVIVPEFKDNNYEAGVTKGVDAIIASITTEFVVDDSTGNDSLLIIVIIGGIGLFLFIMISPWTPLGGEGSWGVTTLWGSGSSSSGGSGFGSFGGGSFGGGGASGRF